MNEQRITKKTDLVLSNGEYAFTQDATTGVVRVLSGPTVVNVTGQEYPVVYDVEAARFVTVDLEDAAQKCPMAPQGFYIELHNPAATETAAQPRDGGKETAPQLLMGRRVNIPGPVIFSLWPRQVAKVIEGHHLRSNQYLLGRVYDEEAAKENWEKAVLKAAPGAAEDPSDGPQGTITELTEDDLSVGKLFVIKGTEVSFYIPPTGVEVVPDAEGRFVRDALTLERLQYCILVDETGDKDYQRGPKVVFPKPTQRFYEDPKTGQSVFRPTELNKKQGILVKVIAPYEEDGHAYTEGEELFITGADTPIYIPRPEHSLIRYDGRAKHFATAVPAGEARYVMNRTTGVIRMVVGPTMLLPDPREEVIVRRVLEDRECKLWYPENDEARRYNGELRQLARRKPSTRSAVTEGEARRSKKLRGPRVRQQGFSDVSTVHSSISGPVADEWMRAATFSEPRTLTLSTKYAGVPTIRVWSGYAVMVVTKTGERRVEIGPKTLLLEYDEALEVLSQSTGMPKSSSARAETVYLKIQGNRILDQLLVRTKEHVVVSMRVAVTVDFGGDDPAKWFSTDDYVGLVVTGVRRRLSERVRALSVDQLHADPATAVREALASGLSLEEHGITVRDPELLELSIEDREVAGLLEAQRAESIASAVALERAREDLSTARAHLSLKRERSEAEAENERFDAQLDQERVSRQLALSVARTESTVAQLVKKREEQEATDAVSDARQQAALARQRRAAETSLDYQKAEVELELSKLAAMTDAAVARFSAAQGPLAEAITMLGNQQVLATVAEAVSAQRLFGGKNVADVVGSLFEGTRLSGVFARVQRRAVPAETEE